MSWGFLTKMLFSGHDADSFFSLLWINLRIVLKISTVWLISSASILVLIAPVLVCWGFAGEEGIHLLPPRRTNDSNHIETYWVPEYVDQVTQKLDVFFHKNI